MTLYEVVAALDSFDEELAIYAVKPWTAASLAVVAEPPGEGDMADYGGAAYLMGVGEAVRTLDFLQDGLSRFLPITEAVERLAAQAAGR